MEELISVIVPIYNTEKYLRKCIESIIYQTYRNLEIILIDDGSTDDSGKICDEYAQKDSRIVVVHKKNQGLSAARNDGIDIAHGMFLGFVDGDDCIEETMYEKLYSYMIENNCDIVECEVNFIYEDHSRLYEKGENYILSGKETLEVQLKINQFNCLPRNVVWSRLHRTSYWKDNHFPVGKVHEDYMLTCKELYNSKRVGFVNEGLYNYTADNLNSITHAKFSKRDLFLEEQYYQRTIFFLENHEDHLRKLAEVKYYRMLLSLYYKCRSSGMEEEHMYSKLIRKNIFKIIKSSVNKSEKIRASLLAINPKLYWILIKVKSSLK